MDVIDRAVSAGQLTPEQGVVDKVFALFDDPRLPASLRGNDTGIRDSRYMAEVMARFDSFSAETQATLMPFILPPFLKNSWWDLRHHPATAPSAQTVTPVKPCQSCPISTDWNFMATANGKAKVWYVAADPVAADTARDFVHEIDTAIWPKLQAEMGREPLPDDSSAAWYGDVLGGDSRLDIAVLESFTFGLTIYDAGCNPTWSSIELPGSGGKEMLAHELMHAFQTAFSRCNAPDTAWLMESTAEWAIDYVYPDSNDEHEWAQDFTASPQLPLDEANLLHEYSAYLFPFFLTRVKAQKGIVGRMWANTESMPSLDAVDAALQPLGGFEKVWREFTLYNWDRPPVDDYAKIDALTLDPTNDEDSVPHAGSPDDYWYEGLYLPHLSAQYIHATFTADARSVAFLNGMTYKLTTVPRSIGTTDLGLQFDWTDRPADAKRGAAVMAIVKKSGVWQKPEDWTNVKFKSFCRDNPDEAIDEIVLIFSNGNKDRNSTFQQAGLPPLVIATNMGCAWKGTARYTINDAILKMYGNATATYEVQYDRSQVDLSNYFLGYAYTVSGQASWNVFGVNDVGCALSGSGTGVPVTYDDPAGVSFNFAPQGSLLYRKAHFAGRMAPMMVTVSCPQEPPQQAPYLLIGTQFPFPGSIVPLPVSSDGSVKARSTDFSKWWQDYFGTWTVEFTPK